MSGNSNQPAEPRGETIPIVLPPWQVYKSELPPTITGRHQAEPPKGR